MRSKKPLISLDAKDFKTRLAALSGAGKVPVLVDGDIRIWESLAILEYLAERLNVRRRVIPRALDQDAAADVARIDAVWNECRGRFGSGGPFLYGSFSTTDAMYAPVVWQFHTYAIEVSAVARDYMSVHMALSAWNEWREAARHDPGYCQTTRSTG